MQLPSFTFPSVELQRPLPVERAQCPELQWHGVGAGAGRVLILEAIVVVVLDRSALRVEREGPEAVQMDLLAEARGQSVHEQARGGSFDVHVVGQPVPVVK